jgi:hypothetical protein
MKFISLTVVGFALAIGTASAADEKLPKELICAPAEINKCTIAEGCANVSLAEPNAPTFIKVDLDDNKLAFRRYDGSYGYQTIGGRKRLEKQLLLHGVVDSSERSPDGYAWSMSLTETGRMALSVSAPETVYTLLGNCEVL